MRSRHYLVPTMVRRMVRINAKTLADAYRAAAAWLEEHPQYDAHTAISYATNKHPDSVYRYAFTAFREAFGVLGGDDESVLMLCFAAEVAESGEL
jgi:hypothetical protein